MSQIFSKVALDEGNKSALIALAAIVACFGLRDVVIPAAAGVPGLRFLMGF